MTKFKKVGALICAFSMMLSMLSVFPAMSVDAVDAGDNSVTLELVLVDEDGNELTENDFVVPGQSLSVEISLLDGSWTKSTGETYVYDELMALSGLYARVALSSIDTTSVKIVFEDEYDYCTVREKDAEIDAWSFVESDSTMRLAWGASAATSMIVFNSDDVKLITYSFKVSDKAEDGDEVAFVSDEAQALYAYGGGSDISLPVEVPDTVKVDAAKPTIKLNDTELASVVTYDYSPTFTAADTASGVAKVTYGGTEVTVAADGTFTLWDETDNLIVWDNVGNYSVYLVTVDSTKAATVASDIDKLYAMLPVTYLNVDDVQEAYDEADAAYAELSAEAQASASLANASAYLSAVSTAISTYNTNAVGAKGTANDAIADVATAEPITWADKATVETATEAVKTYTETYGGDTTDLDAYSTLTAAEGVIAGIVEDIEEVEAAITALGTIDYTDASAIVAARTSVTELVGDGADIAGVGVETSDISNYQDLTDAEAVIDEIDEVAGYFDALVDELETMGSFDYTTAKPIIEALEKGYQSSTVTDDATDGVSYLAYFEAYKYDVAATDEAKVTEYAGKVSAIDDLLDSIKEDIDDLEYLLDEQTTTQAERNLITALQGSVKEATDAGLALTYILDDVAGTGGYYDTYADLCAIVQDQTDAYDALVTKVNNALSGVAVTYALNDTITGTDGLVEEASDLYDTYGLTLAEYNTTAGTLLSNAVETIEQIESDVSDLDDDMAGLSTSVVYADKTTVSDITDEIERLEGLAYPEDSIKALDGYENYTTVLANIDIMDDAIETAESKVGALPTENVTLEHATAIEDARAAYDAIAQYELTTDDEVAEGINVSTLTEAEAALSAIASQIADYDEALKALPTAEGTVTVSIYNTAVTLKTEIDTYNTSVNASSASDYTYYGNLQIVFDNYEAEIIEVLAGYEDTLEDWDINSDNVQYEDKATVATMTSLLEALENKGVDLEASLSADAYSKYTTAVAAVAEMQKAIDAQYDANKELEDEWTLLDPEAEVNKYDAATTASDDLASKYGLSDEQAEELLATDSITTAEGYQTYVEDTIANFVLNYAVLLYNSGATSADVDEMNEILAELKTGVFNLEADQLKTLLNNEVEVQAEDLGLDLDEIEDFDLYAAFNTAYEKYNTSSSSSSSDTDYTGGSIYQDGVTGYWNADGVFVWYGYWEDGVFIYTVDLNTVYVSPESGVVTSTSTSGATSPTTGDPETGDETVATTTPSTTTTEEPTVADTAADDVTVEDVLTDSTTVASLATTDSSVGSILLVVAALAVVCGVALVVLYKRKEAEAEED